MSRAEPTEPLVSICCAAYNHEAFIRDALDSFLAQRVDFPIEILVNDDASTDGTPAILREYERKYPDRVSVTCQTENQYSRGLSPFRDLLYPRARGKYIALCEGDDYWTDPEKLRRQVRYMEEHPGCTLTCGGYEHVDPDGSRTPVILEGDTDDDGGFTFGLRQLARQWMTKTLTAVFRRDDCREACAREYQHFRDVHLFYHLVKAGYGYYFRRSLGAYRVHGGGIHSTTESAARLMAAYRIGRELYAANRDSFTRWRYQRLCVSLLVHGLARDDGRTGSRSRVFREAAAVTRTPREAIRLVLAFSAPGLALRVDRFLEAARGALRR